MDMCSWWTAAGWRADRSMMDLRTYRHAWSVAVLLLLSAAGLSATVKVGSMFSSDMVLQRGIPVPVWGTATPGESVAVSFNGQRVRTTTGTDSQWTLTLAPMNAGGPFDMTVDGTNRVQLRNLLIGDVWICSGQSNMSFELKKSSRAAQDIPDAHDRSLRLFTVPRVIADAPLRSCGGTWTICTPEQAEDFSAVAYYFGKTLRESLDVPIGLIHVSWGGTAAEGWVSRGLLQNDPDFRPILDRWEKDLKEFPDAMARYTKELPAVMQQWLKDSADAAVNGRMAPRKPAPPRGPGHRDTPNGQFYGMLPPVIPFAMRGVIWYQGEANAGRAQQYRRLFPALINEWRSLWKQGDFPFYYVQLPNLSRQPEPSKSGWAELRESQLMTLSVPNTGMAVTIDVGDPKDLHPTNKRPVGERLARLALADTYGHALESTGPLYNKAEFLGASVRIAFSHTGKGLMAGKNGTVTGFTIAGADKKFVPASAVIDGNSVIVSSPQIKVPVSVRYAWADNPECDLKNSEGLPASPFRTDDWPEVTAGKK